jgi:hypothetical protein
MAENSQATEIRTSSADLQIIRDGNHFVEALRPDGLTVFLDCGKDNISQILNHLRTFASPESLIRILGIVRGHQISLSYARRYMPAALPGLEADFTELKAALMRYVRHDCADSELHISGRPLLVTGRTDR